MNNVGTYSQLIQPITLWDCLTINIQGFTLRNLQQIFNKITVRVDSKITLQPFRDIPVGMLFYNLLLVLFRISNADFLRTNRKRFQKRGLC